MATGTGGLEDVVAAESAITSVDGMRGELRYRGYSVPQLAESVGFEAAAFLLWNGELPQANQLVDLSKQLRSLRTERADVMELVVDAPEHAHPLDVLRLAVARDAVTRPDTWTNSADANRDKAVELTAWFPTAVAALHRRRSGLQPVAPREDLDTAASFLWMLHGKEPARTAVDTLNASLVLHADHELNASTFAARVTVATQSNLHAAVISALGTLSGPRHGGASDRVIHMLRDIGTPERADAWVRERLARKERIMGFGHRAYRTTDPRARTLRSMARLVVADSPEEIWIDILDALSDTMAREKSLYPNVDLFAAVVNYELGIRPEFYTSAFAVARIVGWTAHAIEQLQGRMIRPVSQYTGPEPRDLPTAPFRAGALTL